MFQETNHATPTGLFTIALLGLAASALLLTTTACDTAPPECAEDIAYSCPDEEEECADPGDEACKQYTFGTDDCAQTIFCAVLDDTAANEAE